jgi:hypothetical protein
MRIRAALWTLIIVGFALQAAAEVNVTPLPNLGNEPFHINWFGRWSYAVALAPYYGLLVWLGVKYRVIWKFRAWQHFFLVTAAALLFLGIFFEWIADVLFVWTFPPGRDFFMVRVPIFGWFTGHTIPICEFLWIFGVVPLFYYLYLWATLAFYDVIYVLDDKGNVLKKEERWVGPHEPTRILTRHKDSKDGEQEVEHFRRKATWIGRKAKRFFDVKRS